MSEEEGSYQTKSVDRTAYPPFVSSPGYIPSEQKPSQSSGLPGSSLGSSKADDCGAGSQTLPESLEFEFDRATTGAFETVGANGMVIAWQTPKRLFNALNAEFGFTVDVCASEWNHQCEKYYTIADDGLRQEWIGVCWCNPPFDATKGMWVEKAWRSAQKGVTAVVLLAVNATEDTEWWHQFVVRSSEIRYIRGRPLFRGENGAEVAMRCVILVMRAKCQGPPRVISIDKHGERYA